MMKCAGWADIRTTEATDAVFLIRDDRFHRRIIISEYFCRTDVDT